ncbi:MAG: hypothetical protein CMI36_05365 [Owenweeksia sp.]|nr:hypothetical protein [Owenweeksia sp.]MBF98398.1 hypothetical protein [Owenweeksia sp.]HBF20428.1 hypothetical protein [Cryomorphaceae bacterium]HCQ14898.1 hypothetical protein [Cryomorphaceae bacterium]
MKKNSSIPNPPRRSYAWMLALAGLIAGGLIVWVFKPEPVPVPSPAKTPQPQTKTSGSFLNPGAASTDYRKYDPSELKGIRAKIEQNLKGQQNTVALYFRDLTNDQWWGINETEVFSPASLMKVPVMIAILKFEDQNPGVLSQTITYEGAREQLYKKPVNAQSPMMPGSSYKVEQLLNIMITASDNEATILLMKFLDQRSPGFRKKVEEELDFRTPAGGGSQKDFVTVRRYSAFFRTLYNASYLSEAMSDKALAILAHSGFGFGIRQAIPPQVRVSHKYGYRQINATSHQYHHFAIVYHSRKPFLLGIMTKGTDPNKLKTQITALAEMIYREVDTQTSGSGGYLERDLE